MKHIITLFLFFMTVAYGSAQKIDSAAIDRLTPQLKEEANLYLNQAKKARTTGMVLAIGGGAIAVVGGIILAVDLADETVEVLTLSPDDENSSAATTGGILFGVGAATALASIPFFIKVHKKREAVRAILYSDKGVSPATGVVIPGTQSTGIGLVIEFGR